MLWNEAIQTLSHAVVHARQMPELSADYVVRLERMRRIAEYL
jgi:hypothetical protein